MNTTARRRVAGLIVIVLAAVAALFVAGTLLKVAPSSNPTLGPTPSAAAASPSPATPSPSVDLLATGSPSQSPEPSGPAVPTHQPVPTIEKATLPPPDGPEPSIEIPPPQR